MSALATAPAAGIGPEHARPGLVRLTGVELRKMVDTRAGLWLLLTTAALTLAAIAIVGFAGEAADHRFRSMLEVAIAPASVLLPVIGILLVTSEWTQRTALVTFALVPQRGRVLVAKLAAGLVLAVAAFLLSLAIAAAAVAVIAPEGDGVWSLPVGLLLQDFLMMATGMAMGIGFGAALLASAPAIVLYFALPMAFGILGEFSFFEKIAEWVDSSRALAPMTSELLSGEQWARAITALALWMLLPLLIGAWRLRREELK
ncbi:ABC transporter permease [Conexibacter arvalis]|uniref:ABC-type transport system involved in multi-copper enzyme maturation permease subunit n=1 Tax=Conexibacter arvalis TaxID=912552 RepID=A0A840IB33_9ACTN|nr:ABC transporter permease [Conexibacter arvalis]MBB4661288.1 ABC-type transport system involved in multi-copper enzyme maturation permease subunit [Conexibacter arvalis]